MAVKLPPLLSPDRIQFNKKIESQKTAFDTLTNLLVKGQSQVDKNEIFDALVAREKLGNTCIGNGIVIPRALLDITNPRAALLVLKRGLETNAVDKKPIKFFLAILFPKKDHEKYSAIVTQLNNRLAIEENQEKLANIKNPELLVDFFQNIINEKESD